MGNVLVRTEDETNKIKERYENDIKKLEEEFKEILEFMLADMKKYERLLEEKNIHLDDSNNEVYRQQYFELTKEHKKLKKRIYSS